MSRIAIAIAGASCSGKTTLAHLLQQELNATLVRIDDYYRCNDHLSFEHRCGINYDHPREIEHELLVEQVELLLQGAPIHSPRYVFAEHNRSHLAEPVTPTEVILVEGLFALTWPELTDLCAIRIFVDAPEEVCLARRLYRDVQERGRTPEEVICRFTGQAVPMFREHVLPFRCRATHMVDGTATPVAALGGILASLKQIELREMAALQ